MPDFSKIPVANKGPISLNPGKPSQPGSTQTLGSNVGATQQNLFQFYLEKCVITNTRSIHEDTLLAGFGVILTSGATVHAPQVICAKVGNHNNTTFAFWQQGLDALNGIQVNPTDQVTFLYEIYNNGAHGHPNPNELTQLIGDHLKLQAATNALQSSNPALAQALVTQQQLDQLKQQMSSSVGNAQTNAAVAAASIFSGGLYGVFYSVLQGCDGIVAAGTYSVDGKTLAARIASSPNNVIAQTDTSNGKQNGWGAPCNPHGSNYLISWIIQRQP